MKLRELAARPDSRPKVEKLEWKGDSVVSASGRLNLEGSVKSTKYKLNWLPALLESGIPRNGGCKSPPV